MKVSHPIYQISIVNLAMLQRTGVSHGSFWQHSTLNIEHILSLSSFELLPLPVELVKTTVEAGLIWPLIRTVQMRWRRQVHERKKRSRLLGQPSALLARAVSRGLRSGGVCCQGCDVPCQVRSILHEPAEPRDEFWVALKEVQIGRICVRILRRKGCISRPCEPIFCPNADRQR